MVSFLPDAFPMRSEYRTFIDLNGTWALRRDPGNAGFANGWHEGRGSFRKKMDVPGVPQAQGVGEPASNVKTFFDEPFWIRRKFDVPVFTEGKRLWLRIGGILPAADIYLNGIHVGYTKSSRTPQRIDVTDLVVAGKENLIAIRVCEAPEVRLDGVYEMPALTYNWTGPYGPISCELTGDPSILDLYAEPDLESNGIRLSVNLSSHTGEPCCLVAIVRDDKRAVGTTRIELGAGEDNVGTFLGIDDCRTWSPDDPYLYDLQISLYDNRGERLDKAGIRFGMRKLEVSGSKFLLNGKPVLLRLYGDNHLHPDTLCPPADKNWYVPRLKLARKYGMNGVKGCVETIPPAYVEAADEVGMMIIQEMPFGLSHLRENKYRIDGVFREYYTTELDGLVRTSRNHASIVAYSMSSEVELAKQTQESFDFFSLDLVERTRKLAPHSLVVDCTGYVGPKGLNTPLGRRQTDFYVSLFAGRKDVLDETPPLTDGLLPLILHEYHWWSCYPDPGDRRKYEKTQMIPFWLDSLERTARENGQEHLLETYRRNSLWLQTLCRKDGIEYVRRKPYTEGYILWLLIDLGLWSEGLFDDFWKPKNVSAEEFLRSNGDTVVVLGSGDVESLEVGKRDSIPFRVDRYGSSILEGGSILGGEGNRCFASGSDVSIPIAVDHYGSSTFEGGLVKWWIDDAPFSLSGVLEVPDLEPGNLSTIGTVDITLPVAEEPCKFELGVELSLKGRKVNTNEWSFWAFPEPKSSLEDICGSAMVRLGTSRGNEIAQGTRVVLCDGVDDQLADFVVDGGRCILFTEGTAIENPIGLDNPGDPYKMFRTIPWNAGDHGNSGTVIADHPALESFPHEGLCDLQFLYMLKGHQPMDFGPLVENGIEPIIRMIDHYAANRNVAHMIEFSVGRGAVLATSLGILDNIPGKIEAGYLLKCLLEYAGGEEFRPTARITRESFEELFSRRS